MHGEHDCACKDGAAHEMSDFDRAELDEFAFDGFDGDEYDDDDDDDDVWDPAAWAGSDALVHPEPTEPMDARTIWGLGRGCVPPVRKIIVRKNRAGDTPMSQADIRLLCRGARLALLQAQNVAANLDQIYFQRGLGKNRKRRRAWRRRPAFVEWWGNRMLTNNQFRKMRKRAKKLLRKLRKGITFVVVQHNDRSSSGSAYRTWGCFSRRTGNSARAYASYAVRRIYLCPGFFGGSDHRRAGTIIHEMAHILGHSHHRIGGTSVRSNLDTDLARRMARDRPMRSRRNPVNYANLYAEFSPRFGGWT